MPKFGPRDAEVLVFTFKEGLLSPVAHDLKLRVTTFEIDVDDQGRVTATFNPSSLRVVSAMREGREEPSALSFSDCATIEENIRKDVLHPSRHEVIRFVSTDLAAGVVRGELTLHGTTRAVQGAWREEHGAKVARVELDQEAFGITPYRAMLGTLRIQSRVQVQVRLPGA